MELMTAIESTSAALLRAVAPFNETQFNKVPAEGGWTAGEVAQHLCLAVSADILYDTTQPTERQPGEKIEMTRNLFLNFDIKMQSPDFIMPAKGPYQKVDMQQKLAESWEKIREAAKTLDLTATCTSFGLPNWGTLTRLEWIWFFVFHTQRHTRQLQHIFGKVIS